MVQRQSQTLEDRLNAAELSADGNQSIVSLAAAATMTKALCGKLVIVTAATGVAFTVPKDADDTSGMAVGDWCDVIQGGAGQVTITAGSGATLRNAAATAKILAQYGRVRVQKIGASTFAVSGQLAAS